MNVAVLLLLISGFLALFVFYPVSIFYRDSARNSLIDGNIRINATGKSLSISALLITHFRFPAQAPVLFQMPDLIDTDTPQNARTRTGFDGVEYDLVFSDEFNVDGRTFYPATSSSRPFPLLALILFSIGDDPFWEAVDIWYGSTADLEWYDPQQVTTRNRNLVITMDSTTTTQSGLTSGKFSTPFPSHYVTDGF
jgi:beta-glucan synthesis-associated protein KRE6